MSKIEWTDATWNPIVGCSKCSPGCDNCYAERMAKRLSKMPQTAGLYSAYVIDDAGWTGRTAWAGYPTMTKPLHWRKARRVFVCSMGDLFHETVAFEMIDRGFAIMARCSQHTFQILTKRPERMLEYLSPNSPRYTARKIFDIVCRSDPHSPGVFDADAAWPLPNVWVGVTAENQEAADERIPLLLQTPAAVRFVSIEPMLGEVDISWHLTGCIDWVICGGESGPGARPMHPDWARSLRDQCRDAGVPFFFKQLSGASKRQRKSIPNDLQIQQYPENKNK